MQSRLGLACVLAACTALALGTAGCTFDAEGNAARGCEGCPANACRNGFCLLRGEDRGPVTGEGDAGSDAGGAGAAGSQGDGEGGGGTGGDAAADASTGGSGGAGGAQAPCVAGDFCYDGPAGTATVGRCRAGEQSCDGASTRACLGQITPQAELCNAQDDDCDGATDEELMLGSCTAATPGVCAAGMLTCAAGVSLCETTLAPAAESCNGLDDDCDGNTDEGGSVACFPEGTAGCSAATEGDFACAGNCRSGTRVCGAGALLACADFVAPTAEACDGSVTGTGTDEDCDGAIDEGCSCLNDATQECYSGPDGTAGVGTCVRGTQLCSGGALGACEGAVTPAAESCANEGADNDCDGTADDVTGRDAPCTVAANQGVCRSGARQCSGGSLACITPVPPPGAANADEPTCDGLDEDCDGDVDEGFDLQTDAANCGACGRACAGGESCCGGACVSVDDDALNCGECGTACGEDLSCCGGACVDATSDAANCGACGEACASGEACCSGACSDLQVDDANCGECAIDCGAFEDCSCEMGVCAGPDGACAM